MAVILPGRNRREHGIASLVVRPLLEVTKERLRARTTRHRRSLEAEVRANLKRAAGDPELPSVEAERFPDWFIRMTRPGIDLDEATLSAHGSMSAFYQAASGPHSAATGAASPASRPRSLHAKSI